MKKIKYVFLIVMTIILLVVAGCGNKNILDMYSFGEQAFKFSKSNVTLVLPFELREINDLPGGTKLNNSSNKEATYMGGDKYMSIIVVARKVDENQQLQPLKEIAQQAIERTKLAPSVSNLTYQVNSVTIDNIAAEKMHLDYLERDNKQSVNQYVFYDKDVLWNVIYLYHTDNQVSKDLAQYLDGLIVLN